MMMMITVEIVKLGKASQNHIVLTDLSFLFVGIFFLVFVHVLNHF